MKLPNSLSSSRSGAGGPRAHWGAGPCSHFVGQTGWPANFIFLHLFPHRTQLPFNNTSKELEAGLQAKPFCSSLILAAQIPGTFAVLQEPWPEGPWAQTQTWTGPPGWVDIPAWFINPWVCSRRPPQIKRLLNFRLLSR